MRLIPVGIEEKSVDILFALLSERTPGESISHQKMPTLDQHRKFVMSEPYQVWYLIQVKDDYVGTCYITKAQEVGISIFQAHRRKGYATQALRDMMVLRPGKFYANINPSNEKSQQLFKSLGYKLLQVTYILDAERKTWQEQMADAEAAE